MMIRDDRDDKRRSRQAGIIKDNQNNQAGKQVPQSMQNGLLVLGSAKQTEPMHPW